VVWGLGRVDASGRVGDRTVTGALGWRGGERLTLTAAAGVVIARRDPGGMVTVPARAYLAIPAALRRRCGLRPGDPVLLAAWPGDDANPGRAAEARLVKSRTASHSAIVSQPSSPAASSSGRTG
jgi:hypothetical protein